METERVVILGGGFGGLAAAQALRRAPVQITLVDRRNYHLFQPLLYQVATGGLSPANIAAPLRSVFKRQKNVQVLLGEVQDIDLAERRISYEDGDLVYDWLVVATGSSHHYFGNEQWEAHAPGLKTIEDATEIRSRVLVAFERAEKETDPARIRQLLRFVVVGGGPTGVELAGTLAEIANDTLKHEFRSINPADAEIILLEGGDRVLPSYPGKLPSKAESQLKDLGVTVRTSAMVTDMYDDRVIVRIDGNTETIDTYTVLWGAGVKASPLGMLLTQKANLQSDEMGRVPVEPDLSLRGHSEVFVIGDLARFEYSSEEPLPGVAPVAIQQGKTLRQDDTQSDPRERDIVVSIPRLGNHGHDRSASSCCRGRLVAVQRLFRMADVADHPPHVHSRVSEPPAGSHPVGLELPHLESIGSVDYQLETGDCVTLTEAN